MNVEGTVLGIFPKTERKFRKTILEMLEKDFFLEKFIFRKNKIEKDKKKTKPKRRRTTEGVSQKEMKRGNEKGRLKNKHEGFATITGREKFFFFLKKVFGNKKKEE